MIHYVNCFEISEVLEILQKLKCSRGMHMCINTKLSTEIKIHMNQKNMRNYCIQSFKTFVSMRSVLKFITVSSSIKKVRIQ